MYVAQEHSIYGSSRVGVDNRKDTLYKAGSYSPAWGGANTSRRALGLKSFELSNHLGNVLVTISDKPIYKVSSATIYFNPEITSVSDYYPFGAPITGRSFSSSENYRFGYNTQEKTDEISGPGNHNTATFWEYDPRLGRRWNLDPVVKPWESLYACLSDNPILMVDPDGNDDYFNGEGRLIKQTNTGSKIFIQTATGNIDYSKLPMNSMHNRQVLAKITDFYASQVGISSKVGVSNAPKGNETAWAFTMGNMIHINARVSDAGGGVQPLFDDYNNLKSALIHEKDHRDKNHGYDDASNLEHAEVYLTQIKDPTFIPTTGKFKEKVAVSTADYLQKAAYDELGQNYGDISKVENIVAALNQQSNTTGYKFTFRSMWSANPNNIQFEVRAKPLNLE
jgi:hypothetical protein